MASAVLFDRHPFERTVRWRIVAKELFAGEIALVDGGFCGRVRLAATAQQARTRLSLSRPEQLDDNPVSVMLDLGFEGITPLK